MKIKLEVEATVIQLDPLERSTKPLNNQYFVIIVILSLFVPCIVPLQSSVLRLIIFADEDDIIMMLCSICYKSRISEETFRLINSVRIYSGGSSQADNFRQRNSGG